MTALYVNLKPRPLRGALQSMSTRAKLGRARRAAPGRVESVEGRQGATACMLSSMPRAFSNESVPCRHLYDAVGAAKWWWFAHPEDRTSPIPRRSLR